MWVLQSPTCTFCSAAAQALSSAASLIHPHLSLQGWKSCYFALVTSIYMYFTVLLLQSLPIVTLPGMFLLAFLFQFLH